MCEREEALSQYASSPMFQGWLNSFSDRMLEVCDAYKTLEIFFQIDSASGKWLDLLGVIIGQPREVVDGAAINFFAFENIDPLTSGLSVGKFWNGVPVVPGNVLVDDITYRKLIKARAFKNAAGASIEDIITAVFLLTGRDDCNVLDGGLEDSSLVTPDLMTFSLEFDSALDVDDKFLILALDLLPRPAGVRLATIVP